MLRNWDVLIIASFIDLAALVPRAISRRHLILVALVTVGLTAEYKIYHLQSAGMDGEVASLTGKVVIKIIFEIFQLGFLFHRAAVEHMHLNHWTVHGKRCSFWCSQK